MATITVEQLQILFRRADIDGNGKVSIDELFINPGFSLLFPSLVGANSGKGLLEKADSDKDGSITFEEFKKAVQEAGILG